MSQKMKDLEESGFGTQSIPSGLFGALQTEMGSVQPEQGPETYYELRSTNFSNTLSAVDVHVKNRGRPRKAKKTCFPAAHDGEKLFGPWTCRCKGLDVRVEIRPDEFVFMLFLP